MKMIMMLSLMNFVSFVAGESLGWVSKQIDWVLTWCHWHQHNTFVTKINISKIILVTNIFCYLIKQKCWTHFWIPNQKLSQHLSQNFLIHRISSLVRSDWFSNFIWKFSFISSYFLSNLKSFNSLSTTSLSKHQLCKYHSARIFYKLQFLQPQVSFTQW